MHNFTPNHSQATITGYSRKSTPGRNGATEPKYYPLSENQKPPCWRCPKKNPTEGEALERNLPKADKAISLYYESQGCQGRCLGDEPDSLVTRDLGIVREIMDEAQLYHLTTIAHSAAHSVSLKR